MTVYVAQQPSVNKNGFTPDLSSASEYGELKFVFDASDKVYSIPNPSYQKACRSLKNFNPETDYVLFAPNSDPASWFAVALILGAMNLESVTMLYWNRKRDEHGVRDGKTGFYFPCKFNLKQFIHSLTEKGTSE